MRLVSWNIRHGGGRRVGAICDALIGHAPDVIILTEYRSGPGVHGFVEAWRLLHPRLRAFSWYSRRGGADLNGFRIDHAFISERLRERLVSCEYSDIERSAGVSDHAALLLELRAPVV